MALSSFSDGYVLPRGQKLINFVSRRVCQAGTGASPGPPPEQALHSAVRFLLLDEDGA